MSKENLIINKILLEPIEGYSSGKLVEFLKDHSQDKIRMTAEKEKKYNGSWQTDGIMSTYYNLKRKMDRINNMFKEGHFTDLEKINDKDSETVIDTLVDLANYSDFFVFYLISKIKEGCNE